MDRTSKLGAVFICLFALPFAGFGLFALSRAITQMLAGTGNSQVWLLLIFGVVFSGVGCGLMCMAICGSKFLKRQQRAQSEHPAEPWLWREDWAQGRIKGNTQSGMITAWVFAAFWNLVSAPMLVFVPQQAARKPIAYLGLLFPVVGVFLLVRAVRFTLAYLEFGKTCFEMSPVPGVVGGDLKGMIQARFPHSPEHGIQLRLSCVNRVITGSGNNQNTSERIVWRGEQSLSPAQIYPGPAGTSIPVSFRVPWDARPTETQVPRDSIVWMLDALADVPGVDYHDIFEVPVFRTAQTPAQRPAEGLASKTDSATAKPSTLTVAVTESAAGVACRRVNKVREGRPHVVDMIKNDEVALIVNTTEGKQAVRESRSIRREAVARRVTYYTTVAGARATCDALDHLGDIEVNRLQDLHKEFTA